MRSIAILAACLGLIGAPQVGAQTPASAPVQTIDLNEIAPVGGPEDLALRRFTTEVRAATHGRILIRAHLNASLGDAQASVEGMMFGELNMFSSDLSYYVPLMIDEVSGLGTPFLITGPDAARRYMASPLLDEARDKVLTNRRVRFLEMSALRTPPHVIASRRRVASLDDLKGLKITSDRPLTNTAAHLWAALGAIYVPPPASKDYAAALKAGRIDAVILPDAGTAERWRIGALAPHLTAVEDGPRFWQISINETLWKRLSPADQSALFKAAGDSARVFEQVAAAQFARDIAHLKRRDHASFDTLDAAAARRKLMPTYQILVSEGALNPRVLAAANSAVSAAP